MGTNREQNTPFLNGLLFIDFSNAYNKVDRKLLYNILRKRNVLEEDEIKYLEALHERILIQCGEYQLYTQNGVHQGSPISPLLFNIYLDDMLRKLCSKLAIAEDEVFAYADDLAFMLSTNKVTRTIQLLRVLCQEYNMQINNSKSGIMWIYSKNEHPIPPDKIIEGIPVVPSYKYLGIDIDMRGDTKKHLKRIQRKINFVYLRLLPLLNSTSFEMRKSLWECFRSD